jgi:hypothetical protein
MLKAEVAGIGFPEVGTPQGGVISPLLSNVVLNELDWWITSQWEEVKTHTHKAYIRKDNGKTDKGKLYSKLRKTKLKECYIVRYADDFKIFCRNRSDAEKLFTATKLWLKDRLGLDVSLEKSKIINLTRHFSEFLGFKLKLHPNGKNRHTVKSHISSKAETKIKTKAKALIKEIQRPKDGNGGYKAVLNYNAFVIGIHNYYNKATHVSLDFTKIAFSVKKSLKARLKTGLKPTGKHLPDCIKERYGSSSQLKYVHNTALAPISYIQHKNPMFKKLIINKYTIEGREEIHNNLEYVDMGIMLYLMQNPVIGRSMEYNDNRLSLYSAQLGKCAVTKAVLEIGGMHCHHKTPVHLGGGDNYMNLVLVTDEVHRLIHAVDTDIIAKYLEKLDLNKRQLAKVNKLRSLANREMI